MTPLHLACTYEKTNVAKILLEAGATIRCIGEKLQTPLHKVFLFFLLILCNIFNPIFFTTYTDILMSLINLKACAAGDFEIASMLTCAAEQVLGRKGVLEVISQNQNLSSPKY